MPIKKRGGGGAEIRTSYEPLPKLKPIPRNPDKKKKRKTYTKKPTPPKPTPTLSKVKRRNPMSSEYVYTDGGVLVIKTPPVATQWDNEFRMRIIRDYTPPRTLKMISEYQQKYEDTDVQKQVFKILGKKVQVHYPHEPITATAQTVVLRTDVVNLTDGKRLFLNHREPAMRVLMVYCFLTETVLGGVPKLIVDEYPAE